MVSGISEVFNDRPSSYIKESYTKWVYDGDHALLKRCDSMTEVKESRAGLGLECPVIITVLSDNF